MSIHVDINIAQYVNKAKLILGNINIGHLLLLALLLHVFVMSQPSDGFIFDEAHYVPAARDTMNFLPANIEHTPLTKIVVAISIKIFGDWWFAWRAPIVASGIAALYVFYLITKRFMQKKYALAATAFLVFDVLFFVHSSIYVLDMPAILFGLVGIELYFARRYFWSGAAFGVAFLMKELALLMLLGTVLYHITTKLRRSNINIKSTKLFGIFFAAILVVSMGGLWMYDTVYKPMQGTTVISNVRNVVIVDPNGTVLTTSTEITNITSATPITNPYSHLMFALTYFKSLVPAIQTEDTQLRQPWMWVLPLGNVLNAPLYYGVTVSSGDTSFQTIRWVSQESPFIEYALFPILAACLIVLVKRDRSKEISLMSQTSLLLLTWICSTYLPWLFLGLFVQRMTFNYYLIYTTPALAFGIPFVWTAAIKNEKYRDIAIFAQLALAAAFFVAFYPLTLLR